MLRLCLIEEHSILEGLIPTLGPSTQQRITRLRHAKGVQHAAVVRASNVGGAALSHRYTVSQAQHVRASPPAGRRVKQIARRFAVERQVRGDPRIGKRASAIRAVN